MTYWHFLAVHPCTLAASLTAILAVGSLAGVIAASGVLLVVSALLAVVACTGFSRRAIDRVLADKRRRERACAREARLERVNSPRASDLRQLTTLVPEIERALPTEGRLLDLEELLEYFVECALILEHCRRLVLTAGTLVANDSTARRFSPLRTELARRRIELREACEQRVTGLEVELDTIIEFVRLLALKAACPQELPEPGRAVERRLWELELREAAMKLLAAP